MRRIVLTLIVGSALVPLVGCSEQKPAESSNTNTPLPAAPGGAPGKGNATTTAPMPPRPPLPGKGS